MNNYIDIHIKAFVRKYKCPICGGLDLIHDLTALASDPAQYPHKCDDCGHMTILLEKNGRMHYEPITDRKNTL